ncbi:hypothetical protein AB0O90_17260 [Microbacterium testaceum]|uniref:hypothetical protein n=1 Tax=Microbacterium testaceum TaxID=2033 RepID=UPI00343EDDA4
MTKQREPRPRQTRALVAARIRYVITGRWVLRRGDVVKIGTSFVRYRVANWGPFGSVQFVSEATGKPFVVWHENLNNVWLVERQARAPRTRLRRR